MGNLNKKIKKSKLIDKIYRLLLAFLSTTNVELGSKLKYFVTFHKPLNLKNPKTFNEKLMYLKIKEDDELKSICADKVKVRDYLKEKGLADYLIDIIGIYSDVQEIDFDMLPESFVIKCNHGSGCNIVCNNKNTFDKDKAIKNINNWMNTDYSLKSAEPHYSRIEPKILIEHFLGKKDGSWPIDYKIHCFNGEPKIFEVILDREIKMNKSIMLDMNWSIKPYTKDALIYEGNIEKPKNFKEMFKLAERLSNDFRYVRVDLYEYEEKIYFGELTFTPAGCVDTDLTETGEFELGNLLNIDDK